MLLRFFVLAADASLFREAQRRVRLQRCTLLPIFVRCSKNESNEIRKIVDWGVRPRAGDRSVKTLYYAKQRSKHPPDDDRLGQNIF